MPSADFRTFPSGSFPPGTSVDRITFNSPIPMEVRPGTGAAVGENGLGQSGGGDLAVEAEWDRPATVVVVRISVSDDTGRIDLFDASGAVVATQAIAAPPRRLQWQNIAMIVPAGAQAVRAGIVNGGVDSLMSILSTQ